MASSVRGIQGTKVEQTTVLELKQLKAKVHVRETAYGKSRSGTESAKESCGGEMWAAEISPKIGSCSFSLNSLTLSPSPGS